MKFKIVLPIILVIGILLIVVAVKRSEPTRQEYCYNFSERNISIGDEKFSIATVQSSEDQAKGLAGCGEVPNKSGLYFPYDPPKNVSFWMRGMIIPIDIIWIGESAVIGIEEDLQPPADITSTAIPTFQPPSPVTGVLEIKAGGAKEHGITVGDEVLIN